MSGPGLTQDTYPTGRLSIEGTSGWLLMHGPAWNVLDCLDLWVEANKRGQDRLLPTTAGVVAYKRRTTATDHLLSLAVCGDCDRNGVTNADPWVGLQANLAYLYDQIVVTPSTTAGTRNARLTMPNGTDRSAATHVLGIERGPSMEGTNVLSGLAGVVVICSLSISIPSGRFA